MSYYVIIGQMAQENDEEMPFGWAARVFHTEVSANQFLHHIKGVTERLYRNFVECKDEVSHESLKAYYKSLAVHDYVGCKTIQQSDNFPNPIFYSLCVSPHG